MKKILLSAFALMLGLTQLNAQSLWENNLDEPSLGTRLSSQNPYTTNDVVTANLTVSGIGFSAGTLGATGANTDRYLVNGWNTTGAIDDTEYFSFTLNPAANTKIVFNSLEFGYNRGGTASPICEIRANLKPDGTADNYTTPIFQFTTATNSGTLTPDLSSFDNVTAPITFRVYWYGATATAGVGILAFKFKGSVLSTMPVTLAKPLTAKATGANVQLGWATATESNSARFDIMRAGADGKFAKVGERATTSPAGNAYAFTHFNVPAGVNFYKLIQVDNNGKTEEFAPVSVNVGTSASQLTASATDAGVALVLTSEKAVNGVVLGVTDLSGRVVAKTTVNVVAGQNSFSVPARLGAGVYVVSAIGNGIKQVKKVVKY